MRPHRDNCTTGATRFGWLFAERLRTLRARAVYCLLFMSLLRTLRAVHWLEPLD